VERGNVEAIFQTLVGWGVGNALTPKLSPYGFLIFALFVLMSSAVIYVVSPKIYRMVK
jgi:hypothetical protein